MNPVNNTNPTQAASAPAVSSDAAVVKKMIIDSHGGLDERSARQVLAHRADYAKANPKKKP